MLFLNNSLIIFSAITEFVNSVLIPFLQNYFLEGITVISIIYLATRQKLKGALDTTAKLVGIAAGSTIVYNSWFKKSSSSLPEGDDNQKDKKDGTKSENKQTSSSNVTNGK